MDQDAVFTRDGARFVPGRHAIGPWAADRLHGGPVIGLIAREMIAAEPDPELVLARLTVDMFRAVPAAPVTVEVEPIRKGSRLALLRAAVLDAEGAALTQATALLLRAGPLRQSDREPQRATAPIGPDGLETESLARGAPRAATGAPPGFHTLVETRWVPTREGAPLAIWFRLPIPLVAGEPTPPQVAALALADFANAIAAIAASRGAGPAAPYINADTTLYLSRPPQGEWFCLQEGSVDAGRGISAAHVRLFDAHGPLGHAMQARLALR